MSSRGRKTVADIARSLGVLLAVILPAVFVWRLVAPDAAVPLPTVDPAPVIGRAVSAGEFVVLAPPGVPEGWTPTSARFEGPDASAVAPSTLAVGYLTEGQEYVGYQQTNRIRAGALADLLGAPEAEVDSHTVTIAGTTWDALTSDRGETVLVLVRPDSLVTVSGSAPDADLQRFAGSLVVQGP